MYVCYPLPPAASPAGHPPGRWPLCGVSPHLLTGHPSLASHVRLPLSVPGADRLRCDPRNK
eukprot:11662577-Heterocapsa_arctica.AAC.1